MILAIAMNEWMREREKSKCYHISHFNDLLDSNRRITGNTHCQWTYILTILTSGDWNVTIKTRSDVVKWINYGEQKALLYTQHATDNTFIEERREWNFFYCIVAKMLLNKYISLWRSKAIIFIQKSAFSLIARDKKFEMATKKLFY